MASTGFFSSLIMGVVISLLGIVFMAPLLRLLGATETILPHAEAYMDFIILGAPFMTSTLMLNNLLRYQGNAFYGMIGTVAGAVLNVALDPLFIFTFDMGIQGASLATMLSQMVSFFLLLIGCMRKDNVRIRLKDFAPSISTYKEIIRGGFPSLCRQGFASIAVICLNQAARSYGDAGIAAISIVNRVTMMAGSALIGFGQGFQPVCGFNYGAKLYGRVQKALWFCVRISTGILIAFSVCGCLFAPDIIALFRKDDLEVIDIGARALRLQCLTFPLTGWIVLNNMLFQTTGKALEATILALSRQGIFLILALLILTPLFGLLGIQLSQPVADVAAFILTIPLYRRMSQEMRGMRKEK
jgi:putative MATE family efflux protein